MDKARFDQILERCNDQEKINLTVLYNAVLKALKQIKEKNTKASIDYWSKSEAAYTALDAKLWAKYFEPTLPNIRAVVDHLKKGGWKISQSTAYAHKKAGLLRSEPDGTFKISSLDKYINTAELQRLDGRTDDDTEKLAEAGLRIKNRKELAQAEHWELKTKIAQGLYVPKDAFERELAQRAMIFKSDMESHYRAQAGVIIALVGGDKDKIPDLIEFLLAAGAGWLNRYASDREFVVPVQTPDPVLADLEDDDDAEGEE